MTSAMKFTQEASAFVCVKEEGVEEKADDFCDEIYAGGISFCVREGGKLCYLVSR